MKKLMTILLAVLLSSAVFAAGQQEAAPAKVVKQSTEPITLRFGAVNPTNHPFLQGAQFFADEVKKNSGGRITIDLYPSSQLGGVSEMVQAVQVGALDFTFSKPGTIADMGVKEVYVYELPYVFRDEDHLNKVMLGEVGEKILASVQAGGTKLVSLAYHSDGARSFFTTKKPIKSLDDMKGLKVRVQNIQMFVDLMEGFGASATPIAYSELYSALQTGVVDAAENPVAGYYTNNFFEVAPYFTFDTHTMAPSLIHMSEISWNKLSSADQKIIKDAAVASTGFVKEFVERKNKEYIADMESKGATFYELSDKDAWIEAATPVFYQYGAGLTDLIKEIQAVK
ncbi:TRAP transporter substrate-binding protein [Oceanispirochaeta sp.]|jgi:tripartite ATP-independent transporter DctP family solute receptor|uniref:TRAP transporter substrate-binding protein n=1 Tax=Oceanispirochaeta sp. TaxID=2035350 RepID=UPI00262F1F0E|nr:TRAP transporter substrate-binding protein [Oceanispirochaeta sp.]MDA3955106.1 TRAP transporter substrate-binding protein [Oceanispirochaeta sp.]